LVRQDDHHRAGVVQQELVNCLAERFGPEHSDTVTARNRLPQMLLAGVWPEHRDRFRSRISRHKPH
jgi:hypothetical protein